MGSLWVSTQEWHIPLPCLVLSVSKNWTNEQVCLSGPGHLNLPCSTCSWMELKEQSSVNMQLFGEATECKGEVIGSGRAYPGHLFYISSSNLLLLAIYFLLAIWLAIWLSFLVYMPLQRILEDQSQMQNQILNPLLHPCQPVSQMFGQVL